MQAIWNDEVVAESDETSPGAAWQYRHPLPLARKLKNRFAFWGGVHVAPVRDEHQQRR